MMENMIHIKGTYATSSWTTTDVISYTRGQSFTCSHRAIRIFPVHRAHLVDTMFTEEEFMAKYIYLTFHQGCSAAITCSTMSQGCLRTDV